MRTSQDVKQMPFLYKSPMRVQKLDKVKILNNEIIKKKRKRNLFAKFVLAMTLS